MKEDCGKEKYFGPLGKCEDCGKICDRPSHYPESCKTHCPDYIPKDSLTATQLPSSSKKVVLNLFIPVLLSVSLFVLVIFILKLVWKKYLRSGYHAFVEKRRRRKLRIQTRVPLQEEAVEREQDIPLNDIFDDTESISSIIENFEIDVMTSIDGINGERISNQTTEQSNLTSIDTVIFTDEISHGSSNEDFDFGQTFPFHSLPSLESVYERNADQTHRKLHMTS